MGWESGWCNKTSTPEGIFIVKPSLEGWPTKAKVVPSPHEVRLTLLDINTSSWFLLETGKRQNCLTLFTVCIFNKLRFILSVCFTRYKIVIFRTFYHIKLKVLCFTESWCNEKTEHFFNLIFWILLGLFRSFLFTFRNK